MQDPTGPPLEEEHAVAGLLTTLLHVVRWAEPWDLEVDPEVEDPLLEAPSWASPWTEEGPTARSIR